MRKPFYIALLLLVFTMMAKAQQPRLRFSVDSIALGNEFRVSLVFDHKPTEEVFFPQEKTYFAPFELLDITYFPTHTIDTVSTDSVIYFIKTYETDTLQTLTLPIWIKNETDSTAVFSNVDTLRLIHRVPDSLMIGDRPLLGTENTLSTYLKKDFSKSIKWVGFTLLGLGILSLLFRKSIENQLIIYRFKSKNTDFKAKFRKIMQAESASENLEAASKMWREHLEWLERKPISSLSADEIQKTLKDEWVGDAIRVLETVLYSGRESTRLPLALHVLYTFAQERFKSKLLVLKRQLKKSK